LKQVDRTVSVSRKVTIRLVLDEWSDFNVRLATMGPASGTINVYSLAEREDDLVITGTNSIGQKYTWTFPSVSFVPSGSINLISEEWATMEITGTVNAVAGVFGTVARRAVKSRRPNDTI
jgi:PKD repeat protein